MHHVQVDILYRWIWTTLCHTHESLWRQNMENIVQDITNSEMSLAKHAASTTMEVLAELLSLFP